MTVRSAIMTCTLDTHILGERITESPQFGHVPTVVFGPTALGLRTVRWHTLVRVLMAQPSDKPYVPAAAASVAASPWIRARGIVPHLCERCSGSLIERPGSGMGNRLLDRCCRCTAKTNQPRWQSKG